MQRNLSNLNVGLMTIFAVFILLILIIFCVFMQFYSLPGVIFVRNAG